jgi:hypothetical protein
VKRIFLGVMLFMMSDIVKPSQTPSDTMAKGLNAYAKKDIEKLGTRVCCRKELPDGRILFYCTSGLCIFQMRSGGFVTNPIISEEILSDNRVVTTYEDGSSMIMSPRGTTATVYSGQFN